MPLRGPCTKLTAECVLFGRLWTHQLVGGKTQPTVGRTPSTHASTSSSSEGVGHLESLKAVAAFSFLAHHIENAVDELRALGVMTFRPIVPSSCVGHGVMKLTMKQSTAVAEPRHRRIRQVEVTSALVAGGAHQLGESLCPSPQPFRRGAVRRTQVAHEGGGTMQPTLFFTRGSSHALLGWN